jgi:hypothetical protein
MISPNDYLSIIRATSTRTQRRFSEGDTTADALAAIHYFINIFNSDDEGNLKEQLVSICAACGLVLALSDPTHLAPSVSHALWRLQEQILSTILRICRNDNGGYVRICSGVVCSLLLTSRDGYMIEPRLQTFAPYILRAVWEYLMHHGKGSVVSEAPVLLYGNSLLTALSACILQSKSIAELAQLLGPVANISAASDRLSRHSGSQSPKRVRATLQRAIVPLFWAMLQRMKAIESTSATDARPKSRSVVGVASMSIRPSAPTLAPASSNSPTRFAADLAWALSLVYDESSRERVPHLAFVISSILETLKRSPEGVCLLLTRLFPPPGYESWPCSVRRGLEDLRHLMKQNGSRTGSGGSSSGHYKTDSPVEGAIPGRDLGCHEEEIRQACAFAEEWHSSALSGSVFERQSWECSAAFILTILLPCLPQLSELEFGEDHWEVILTDTLSALVVLLTSKQAKCRSIATETLLAMTCACPRSSPQLTLLSFVCVAVLVHERWLCRSADHARSMFQGLSEHLGARSAVLGCCQIACCAANRLLHGGKGLVDVVNIMEILMLVVVHGDSAVMKTVLEMVADIWRLLPQPFSRAAARRIHMQLAHCYDHRKKPPCIRWFHLELERMGELN